MQRRRNRSHETNKYLVSKQSRKQITRKQKIGTMTYSKPAANALGLNKQDNTNDTCAADGKLRNANGIKAMNHILILSRSEEGAPKSNAENYCKQT